MHARARMDACTHACTHAHAHACPSYLQLLHGQPHIGVQLLQRLALALQGALQVLRTQCRPSPWDGGHAHTCLPHLQCVQTRHPHAPLAPAHGRCWKAAPAAASPCSHAPAPAPPPAAWASASSSPSSSSPKFESHESIQGLGGHGNLAPYPSSANTGAMVSVEGHPPLLLRCASPIKPSRSPYTSFTRRL